MSDRDVQSLTPPHDWDTEKALLGGLLVAADLLEDVQAILKPDHFHRPAHARLYSVICALAADGISPNIVSVPHAIRAKGIEEFVGGIAYVTGLSQHCATVEKVEDYARLIRQDWARREALRVLKAGASRLVDEPSTDPSTILAEVIAHVDANVSRAGDGWHALADASGEALREVSKRTERPGEIPGVPTGFPDLDRKLGGLQRGRVYILAARPKMGKSAMVLQIALHVAEGGAGVGIVSLEMGRVELAERALALNARVDSGRMTRGEIDAGDEWRSLLDAHDRFARWPVFVADQPAQSMAAVRVAVRQLRARCEASGSPLGLLVIDYLQLMGGDGERGPNREQIVSAISRGLKMLSVELGIPIIVLSQLNRALETRGDKRPLPSDLRESGALEQDADAILFIYRDEVYAKEASLKKGIAEIIISANRSGETGTVELVFIGSQFRFAPLEDRRDTPPPASPTQLKMPRRRRGRPDAADPTD